MIQPEHVYTHEWRVRDLLIWDNVQTQHLAVDDYWLPQRRHMQRTTVKGPAPQASLASHQPPRVVHDRHVEKYGKASVMN